VPGAVLDRLSDVRLERVGRVQQAVWTGNSSPLQKCKRYRFKFRVSRLNHNTGRFRTDRVERHERRQTVRRNGADESVQHAVQQFPVDDGTVEPVQVAGQRQIERMRRRGNVQISAVSDGFYHRGRDVRSP